jgi:hypothetical protein
MVEHVDVFEAVVPEGVRPANQGGEVARFECMKADEPLDHLAADACTLEAALILARSLARRRAARVIERLAPARSRR